MRCSSSLIQILTSMLWRLVDSTALFSPSSHQILEAHTRSPMVTHLPILAPHLPLLQSSLPLHLPPPFKTDDTFTCHARLFSISINHRQACDARAPVPPLRHVSLPRWDRAAALHSMSLECRNVSWSSYTSITNNHLLRQRPQSVLSTTGLLRHAVSFIPNRSQTTYTYLYVPSSRAHWREESTPTSPAPTLSIKDDNQQ